MKTRIPAPVSAALLRFSRCQASTQSDRPLTGRRSIACSKASFSGAVDSAVIADPGIEPGIDQVDQVVQHDDQNTIEDDHAHDQRVVAVQRALDEVTADAGNGEDPL